MDARRLPARVSSFGPLVIFGERVHELLVRSRYAEALAAADAFECVARAAGDGRTVALLVQGRMYALQLLGRFQEALTVGEQLLDLLQSSGAVCWQAKALADIAESLIRLGRLDEGLHRLARATALLDTVAPGNDRYLSALSSVGEAARAAELYELADRAARTSSPYLESPEDQQVGELQRADLLLEWGIRLEQCGQVEDAAARYAQSAQAARRWVEFRAERGPEVESPVATALLALALAKLGEVDEALPLARALILPARANGDTYAARLAHLAYGVALRTTGDLRAAHRELTAALELAHGSGNPTQRMVYQYELALLAAAEFPGPATRELCAVLRTQAQRLWSLRLDRMTMLREARRRFDLETARARADEAAAVDPLTELGNRRSFDRQMAALDRSSGAAPVVLLLIDVDRFKSINDTHSHGVGDRVLREIAAVLRAHCRQGDVPVRFGGDEFALFLRTDLATAADIAERIRQRVEGHDWRALARGLRVTLSMGAASSAGGMGAGQLFEAADRQLYAAKGRGRNQLAA